MVNPFERLAGLSRRVVVRTHGTAVLIYVVDQSAGPNGRPRLVAGAEYETDATFFQNTLLDNESKAQPLTGNGRMINRSPQIQASITLVPDKPLVTGYFLKRESDGVTFEIVQADPDGLGQVLALLSVHQKLPE